MSSAEQHGRPDGERDFEEAEREVSSSGDGEEIVDAEVELVFEPPWDLGRMSEAARLQLGMW